MSHQPQATISLKHARAIRAFINELCRQFLKEVRHRLTEERTQHDARVIADLEQQLKQQRL